MGMDVDPHAQQSIDEADRIGACCFNRSRDLGNIGHIGDGGHLIGQLPGGSGDPAAGESGGTAPESPDSQPSDGETAPPVDPGMSDGGTAAPDDGFIIVT